MTTGQQAGLGGQRVELRTMVRAMQEESIGPAVVGLYVVGVILFLSLAQYSIHVATLLALLLPTTGWLLQHRSYLMTVWLLVIGSLVVLLLVVSATRLSPALCLLAIPIGFVGAFVDVKAGTGMAVLCSLLPLAPPAGLPMEDPLRVVILISIWGTLGVVWLASRPVWWALEWSWSSYERNQELLEEARDQRVQLRRTLADLAQANQQLVRMNHLVQDLRHAADEARRAKEQFVANVSHEMRTPLNMILGFSEMILRSPRVYGKVPAALLADLAVVLRNSQHLAGLIDDVLDLSQIGTGRMALSRERVSLAEIIDGAVEAVRRLYASKGLYLRVEVESTLPLVYCDRTRIRQVILNLLSNAARFTEVGGVELRAWQEGKDAVISVADTGPGIAPDALGRIFQPFEQLDNSVRRRYGGSGLGLAISRGFVELHGGQMTLESEQGRGSTFYVRLPIDPPAPLAGDVTRWLDPTWEYRQRPTYTGLTTPRVRPRLVVVETDNSLRRLLVRYLDQVEVVSLTSLEEAAAELERMPAQALLVNDTSVSTALERLKQVSLPAGVPVLACALPAAIGFAQAIGAARYLVKPVQREQLMRAIGEFPLAGNTILVVDDEPDTQQLFWRMLASADKEYRVLTAGDGQEALETMRANRPDLVLLDLVMPNMDGFRFLEICSQDPELRSIPIVVISARDPAGEPIVSDALAITLAGGLSVAQLLRYIELLSGVSAARTDEQGNPASPSPSGGQ